MTEGDIAALAALRDGEASREGLLVLEGALLMERALAYGLELLGAIAVPAAASVWTERSLGRFSVFPMTESEIARVAGFPFHRGILGVARRPPIPSLGNFPSGHALCLWGVADPANSGALARTGASLGAASLVLGPASADPYSRIALRASMGAFLALPLFRAGDALECARAFEAAGLRPVAAMSSGGEEPRAIASRGGRFALFLGSEGAGLPAEVVEACALRATLPMSGRTDSLNVAAAGAILMWELFRDERR